MSKSSCMAKSEQNGACPVIVGISLALSLGFVDLVAGMLIQGTPVPYFPYLLAACCATAVLFFILISMMNVLWVSVSRLFDLDTDAGVWAGAVFLGTWFTTLAFGDLLYRKMPPEKTWTVLALGMVCLAFAVTVYFLLARIKKSGKEPLTAHKLTLLLPWLFLELLIFYVIFAEHFGSGTLVMSRLSDNIKTIQTGISLNLKNGAALFGLFVILFATAFSWFRFISHAAGKKSLVALGCALLVMCVPVMVLMGPKTELNTSGNQATKNQPPVFLITVDTLRADAVSAYGKARASTPNIDSLAKDGILYRNAVAPSCWTIPSFASMFTGLPVTVHRAVTPYSRVYKGFVTLAEAMADAGYTTAALGDNATLVRSDMDQGFGTYEFYPNPKRGLSFGARLLAKLLPNTFRTKITSGEIAKRAENYIRANKDKKLFFWVHFFDPHLPYAPPEKYLAGKKTPKGMDRAFNEKVQVQTGGLILDQQGKDWIRTLYEAEVRYVDDGIGRILSALKSAGLYEKSLIIIASDHGEEFWEHGNIGHGQSLYQELIHVPLIVKVPGAKVQGTEDKMVSTEGLKATILKACNVPYDPKSVFTDAWVMPDDTPQPENPKPQPPAFSSGVLFYDHQESVIYENIKLIHSVISDQNALYELSDDPGEISDLTPSRPDWLSQRTRLLVDQNAGSSLVAKQLGVTEGTNAAMDKESVKMLKSLGYLN